jgi:hypothetical protein
MYVRRNTRFAAVSIAAALGLLLAATTAAPASPVAGTAAKSKHKPKPKPVRVSGRGWYVNGSWEGRPPGLIPPGGTDDYCADLGGATATAGGPSTMIAYYRIRDAVLPKGTRGSLSGPGVSIKYKTGRALTPGVVQRHSFQASDLPANASMFPPGTYTFALRLGRKTVAVETLNLVAVSNGTLKNGDQCTTTPRPPA